MKWEYGCTDALLRSIGILATQWYLCYPYLQKSTEFKMRLDDFHRTNPCFFP